MPQSKPNRWYPSPAQLADPSALERSLRQVLSQHYALVDRVDAMTKAAGTKPAAAATASPFPPGSGPTDTYLLGLPVTPIDVETLADGVTLKYSAKQRSFIFS